MHNGVRDVDGQVSEESDHGSSKFTDAEENFNSSRSSQFTDQTEQFHSGQQNPSGEQFDFEQRIDSRQQIITSMSPDVGKFTEDADYRSNAMYEVGYEKIFDSKQQVVAEKTPAVRQNIDSDPTLHDSRLSDDAKSNFSSKFQLQREINVRTSDADRNTHIESQADSLSSVKSEKQIIAESNIKQQVHAPNDAVKQSVIDKKDHQQVVIIHGTPEVDHEGESDHLVQTDYPNDAMKHSASQVREEVKPLIHAARPSDAKEKQQVVTGITPIRERDVDSIDLDQSMHADKTSDFGIKLETEHQELATETSIIEGNADTMRVVHSSLQSKADKHSIDFQNKVNLKQNEHLKEKVNSDRKIDFQQNENPEEKVDSDRKVDMQQNEHPEENIDSDREVDSHASNPEEKVEKFYFSVDPLQPQSILLYTWSEQEPYFTIYMHIIQIKTPLSKPQNANKSQPGVVPFNMWPVSSNVQSNIQPYERYDFLDEREKNKVPIQVTNSNRIIEMKQFGGEN
ncbi:hypothetical protein V9T40_005808 [Parthenolecanium corni]|uniref:Uncharacterized protein n=1 Tax=Parthenolecanium corni TaxID=536013 RepID=A0AAN9YB29_9HEMI